MSNKTSNIKRTITISISTAIILLLTGCNKNSPSLKSGSYSASDIENRNYSQRNTKYNSSSHTSSSYNKRKSSSYHSARSSKINRSGSYTVAEVAAMRNGTYVSPEARKLQTLGAVVGVIAVGYVATHSTGYGGSYSSNYNNVSYPSLPASANRRDTKRNNKANGTLGYTGKSGQNYEYDLSKPLDRLKYEHDPKAQLKDKMSSFGNRTMIDRNAGQDGGGAY